MRGVELIIGNDVGGIRSKSSHEFEKFLSLTALKEEKAMNHVNFTVDIRVENHQNTSQLFNIFGDVNSDIIQQKNC